MTERRRAHWSDDLIEKVRYVYNSQITYADHDEEMESYYAVIAAVEDWHVHRDGQALDVNELLSECMEQVHRAEKAEAAIQRVRDVYEDYFHDRSDLDAVESLEAIRRDLDGPQ